MLIEVTKDHLDVGVPCSGTRCPVALAIKDNLPAPKMGKEIYPHVTRASVEIGVYGMGNKRVFPELHLDATAKDAVKKIDEGNKDSVEPFSFELELPEELEAIVFGL